MRPSPLPRVLTQVAWLRSHLPYPISHEAAEGLGRDAKRTRPSFLPFPCQKSAVQSLGLGRVSCSVAPEGQDGPKARPAQETLPSPRDWTSTSCQGKARNLTHVPELSRAPRSPPRSPWASRPRTPSASPRAGS